MPSTAFYAEPPKEAPEYDAPRDAIVEAGFMEKVGNLALRSATAVQWRVWEDVLGKSDGTMPKTQQRDD